MIKKLLLFSFLSLSMLACKKELSRSGPDQEGLKTLSGTYNFAHYPQVVDDRMVFENYDHFYEYLDFLGTVSEEAEDEHLTLGAIENNLGFVSLRKVAHDEYVQQDESSGWASLQDIPDEHFIAGADLRSILNPDLDMQIGEEIIHYINKDFAVSVNTDHPDILEEFRTLTQPTTTLDDLLLIDEFREYSTVIELNGIGTIYQTTGAKPTGGDYGVLGPLISPTGNCNQPGEYSFRKTFLYAGSQGKQHGWFKIDFGDGTPIEYKETSQSFLEGWNIPTFTHVFPTPYANNQYTIRIWVYDNNSYSGTPIADKVIPITITVPPTCHLTFKETSWQYTQIPATSDYIGGKLTMQNIGGANSPRLRVVADSKLVRQHADGSYHSFKGEMFIKSECDMKNPLNCATIYELIGEGWDSNDNYQTLHRTANAGEAWSSVISLHQHIRNGNTYTVQHTLNVCD